MGSKNKSMSYSRKNGWMVLLFCSLCFCTAELNAQVTDTSVVVEAPVVTDSAYTDEEYENTEETGVRDTSLTISTSIYPADSLKKLQQQKEFGYVKNLDSLLNVWQQEYLKKQKKIEPVETAPIETGFSFFTMFLWLIAIGVVLFVIYRLFLSERGLFAAPARNKKLQVEEEPVADEEYLDQQLKEAIRKGNYRLAVRFLYLQTLSKLSDKGWLQLSPDKTNYQYVKELSKPQYKNEFARITLHYEYAWYGDFTIEEEIFKPVKQEFEQFHLKLKQS
jgi:hypothetical protein